MTPKRLLATRCLAPIRPILLGSGLAGLLGACTVGPDYRPAPATPGSQAALVSVSASAETIAEPPDDWWRLYHDSTLDHLLDEAFKANTDLRAAEANLLASRAVLEGARDARDRKSVV